MSVTRNDVAHLAGVSPATVSYVVNNGPKPVAIETRARVLEAINKLGYQPSAVARNLRLQRTSTLGLIVPDTHNPYFSEVAKGIENVAFENGYTVVLCHSGYEIRRELQYVTMLHGQRVAGTLWVPATNDFSPYYKLQKFNVPLVVIDRSIPSDEIISVVVDNFRGGYLATEHLVNLGHKSIGFIARPIELSHSLNRFEGYIHALKDYGIEYNPDYIAHGGYRMEDGYNAMHTLLNKPKQPTAVFAYNDMMAIGALRALHERGLNVPNDFSVVGFDDIAQSAFTCPSLTTIYVPKFHLGQCGTKILINHINKETPSPDLLKPIEIKLIIRESTGPVSIN